MTLATYLIVFLAIAYVAWSALLIHRLRIRNAGLERDKEQLEGWLKKYEGKLPAVPLTMPERQIMLSALEAYKPRVQEPATKRFIRIIFNTLLEKIRSTSTAYAGDSP